MHDVGLPRRLGEELSGAFGKPDAGVGDDQRDAIQPAALEMLKEPAAACLVLLGTFARGTRPWAPGLYFEESVRYDISRVFSRYG